MTLIIMTSYQGPKEEQGSLTLQNIKDITRESIHQPENS